MRGTRGTSATSGTSVDTGGRGRPRYLRVLFVLCILVAIAAGVRWTAAAESLFYFPSRQQFPTPRGYEDVWFAAPDGTKLHGWFLRARDAARSEVRGCVLHCHGNAGNIESHVGFSSFLTERSMHVFIFDYRSYGQSQPGTLRRAALLRDALAAFDAVAARPDVGAIGVYGVSLGGVFALGVAGERDRVASVCTVSAFSSWGAVAGDHSFGLGRVLIPTGLEPARLARRLGGRDYLVVHGDEDDIVPARHADVLETAARDAGARVSRATIQGAGHNDVMDSDEAREAVATFFSRTLRGD